jgi:hypothetical protein
MEWGGEKMKMCRLVVVHQNPIAKHISMHDDTVCWKPIRFLKVLHIIFCIMQR